MSSSNRTISWKPPSHSGDGRVVDMIQVWTGIATKFWTLPGPGVSLKSCGVVWCETRHRQSCGVEKRTDGPFFSFITGRLFAEATRFRLETKWPAGKTRTNGEVGFTRTAKKKNVGVFWSKCNTNKRIAQHFCFILGFRKGSLKLFFKWLLEVGMRPVQNALMNF